MSSLIGRVLRSAIPAAIVLGIVGLGMQEMIRIAVPSEPTGLDHATENVPYYMAAWGLGLATLLTLGAELWRKPAPIAVAATTEQAESDTELGLDPEVERLLNRIMTETEAAQRV